jgi:3-hydroxymyristoyl/3-hydroxydecanoyl-(acyl carrier protein) dehydratase
VTRPSGPSAAPLPTPLPAIARRSRDLVDGSERAQLAIAVTADLAAFDGHFPGTPILPAVAQVDWAIRLARAEFTLAPRFLALRSLKFLAIVQPPVELALELVRAPDGRSVAFTYRRRGTACASGRIEFTDDAAGTDRSVL